MSYISSWEVVCVYIVARATESMHAHMLWSLVNTLDDCLLQSSGSPSRADPHCSVQCEGVLERGILWMDATLFPSGRACP